MCTHKVALTRNSTDSRSDVQSLLFVALNEGPCLSGSPMTLVEGARNSALTLAAEMGDLAALQARLTAGDSVNDKEKDGYTALILAARYGHVKAFLHAVPALTACRPVPKLQ